MPYRKSLFNEDTRPKYHFSRKGLNDFEAESSTCGCIYSAHRRVETLLWLCR